MEKKNKKKLSKSGSRTSEVGDDDIASVERDLTADDNDGSASEHSTVRREDFICSTSHNSHLDEDYLLDKSQLFGRQLPPDRSSSCSPARPSSASPTIRQVSSERSLRRFFKSVSVDSHSLQSGGSRAKRQSRRKGSLAPVSEEGGGGTANGQITSSVANLKSECRPSANAEPKKVVEPRTPVKDDLGCVCVQPRLVEGSKRASPGSDVTASRRNRFLKSFSADSHSIRSSVSSRSRTHCIVEDGLICGASVIMGPINAEGNALRHSENMPNDDRSSAQRAADLDPDPNQTSPAINRFKKFPGRPPRKHRVMSESMDHQRELAQQNRSPADCDEQRAKSASPIPIGDNRIPVSQWNGVEPVHMSSHRAIAQEPPPHSRASVAPKPEIPPRVGLEEIVHLPTEFSRHESFISRSGFVVRPTLLEFNRLVRRESVVRSSQSASSAGTTLPPVLYKRHSLTHARQSSMDPSDYFSGDEAAEEIASPERPKRSKRPKNQVKRDSIIHPPGAPPLPVAAPGLYQPLYIDGRFQCPWASWKRPSLWGSLKHSLTSKDNSCIPSSQELDKTLPIVPLCEDGLKHMPREGIRVTWLGHSTVLVQFDNLSILTDPMFSERASPVGFLGPKRYRPVPGSIYDLPKIDAVVISHTHYDHLDYNSVLLLNARFGADLQWFVPLGLEGWMLDCGCQSVTELSWWEEGSLPQNSETTFVFTPAQHWCKRTANDDNTVLWGSFSILGPRYRFFFAGDTGYCDAFKQIGNQYGPFDLAAIPIGAYEPRWFMQNQHIDPIEAVKIHKDLRAKKSIGIHWGTFKLTKEHYLEPPNKLTESAKEEGLKSNEFFVLKHGESRLVLSGS